MALPTLKLFIDPSTNIAYSGLNNNDVITDPYFFYGDTKTVELYLRSTVDGLTQNVAWPSTPTLKLAIGPIDDVPTSGTFTVTFGGDTTSALAYNASATTFETALNALASIISAGGVTVVKVGDNYTIEFNTVGNRGTFTANTSALFPLSTALISVVQDGTGSAPEIVILHLRQSAAVSTTTFSSTGTGSATISTLSAWTSNANEGAVTYKIAISEKIVDGTFTLTYDAVTAAYDTISSPINFGATALDIYNALNLTGTVNEKPAVSVNKISNYNYTITFRYQPTGGGLTADSSGLVSGDGYQGTLSVDTAGALALLDGNELKETYLAVRVTSGGAPQTILQIPCTLYSSVIPN